MRRPRDLKGNPLKAWVCDRCRYGECIDCIDVIRSVYSMDPICHCGKPNHSGEPRDQQIKDPETGTVYAPKVEVLEDGTVVRDCER